MHFLAFTRNQNSFTSLTKVAGNAKLEDLQALEESLPLVPEVQLKAELKFICEL